MSFVYKAALLPASVLLGALLLSSAAAAAVSVSYAGVANITRSGDPFIGTIQIVHDILPPSAAVLSILINGAPARTVPLPLQPLNTYLFEPQTFSYNLTATGVNSWTVAPAVSFSFRTGVNYTCLNVNCQCPPADPANASSPPEASCTQARQTTGAFTRTVNATAGLAFALLDANQTLTVPAGAQNAYWFAFAETNPNVTITLRAACGSQLYSGFPVSSDGFVRRRLLCTDAQCSAPNAASIGCTGSLCAAQWGRDANYIFRTIEPFDNASLGSLRNAFGGGLGGVYKGGAYQTFDSAGLIWNGSTGFVQLFDYDPSIVYDIVYLPPNGPLVCAKTDVTARRELAWSRTRNEGNRTATYAAPFSRSYSPGELATLLPPAECLPENVSCIRQILAVDAVETLDPANSVSFSFVAATKTVNATTAVTRLTQNYTMLLNMTALNITSAQAGANSLSFILQDGGATLARHDRGVGVCTDRDGDGFCAEENDCNDQNAAVKPGAAELCDGIDNDCDNAADEDYSVPGAKLGDACNNWIGSSCAGIIACTGSNATACSGKPVGADREICDDKLDNDCDGLTDETADGDSCICRAGATQPCGSTAGTCRPGFQTCVAGVWSACINEVRPSVELCNNADDNCDGLTDNIGARSGAPAADTNCACANGKPPQPETCNGADDNCNGLVDDGIACVCKPGEKRPCGPGDVGICRKGAQSCQNGEWAACEGAVNPRTEICFNQIDENCDGTADERCGEPGPFCRNGVKDAFEEGVDCGGPCPACAATQNAGTLLLVFAAAVALIVLLYIVTLVRAHREEHGLEGLPH